jgi:hypothetical protein
MVLSPKSVKGSSQIGRTMSLVHKGSTPVPVSWNQGHCILLYVLGKCQETNMTHTRILSQLYSEKFSHFPLPLTHSKCQA